MKIIKFLKKINWFNLAIALIFLFSIFVIIHDLYLITFKLASFTIFGFITFILSVIVAYKTFKYLKKESK